MRTPPSFTGSPPRPLTAGMLESSTPNLEADDMEYSMDDSQNFGRRTEEDNNSRLNLTDGLMGDMTGDRDSIGSVSTAEKRRKRRKGPSRVSTEDLRMTRPSGLSPQHRASEALPSLGVVSPTGANGGAFFGFKGDGPSVLEHAYNKEFPAGAGHTAAAIKKKKKKKEKSGPKGNVFQRDSPNAKKSLRSFLLNFTDDRDWTIMGSLNLHQHSLDTGHPITNAMVQEVCSMHPGLTSLDLTKCDSVTDVGLWAIARHCTGLKQLTLSQCGGITNIGLRSLAMKCTSIEKLDFTKCENLDDHALRVIAAGMWGLRVFTLTGCNNITDSGVAEVARCCHKLRILDVSDCEKIGEYGDKALLEVGKYCHELETLNMFGCKHVADAGIKAIANGCRELKELRLTGCRELSGLAVKSLSSQCTKLVNLSIANCQKIENKDLIKLAKGCSKLQNLDISECNNITAKGLQTLARECKEMVTLNLSKCSNVDDDALKVLAMGCEGLRNLDLSGCQSVSEVGIREIAHGCTGIGYLNVTGCRSISRRFLMHLINEMQFSDPAHTYFGYQPKPDADELRRKAKELQEMSKAAISVQRVIRGTLARGGVREIRRAWIIQHQLPKAQAWVRGFLRRRTWYKTLRDRLEHWAASTIRATWRGLQDRRFVKKMLKVKSVYDDREEKSKDIQRLYRGLKGRQFTQKLRDEVARRELMEAQERARLERAATIIERSRRGYVARVLTEELRKERERMRALELLRIKCTRLIQRIYRGFLGREAARRAREAKEFYELQWKCARKLQACWRGKLGRDKARVLREFRDYQRAVNAATKIQSAWRGFRGKYMGKVAASLAGLRNLEQTAAKKIQSCFRAKQGREKAKEKRDALAETLKRMRAVQICQRIFRGHKGREKSAVQKALKKLEHRAKPLFAKLKNEEVELVVVKEKIEHVQGVLEPLSKDTKELEKEIALILRSKAKYWDSDRISGAPQRFVTDWLKIRLDEKLTESRDRVEELEDQVAELQIKEREKLRHIRHISRELVPLTTGTIDKTKHDRTQYLRWKVRTEKAASTLIQRKFRGHWIRSAVYAQDRDFWIEDYDTTTGQNLYINTWSNETRWRKPLSMKFNEEFNLSQKQGGSNEELVKAGGWVQMKDVQRQLTYYFNNSANAYRWTEPTEFENEDEETNSDWFDAQDTDALVINSFPTGKEIGVWTEMCENDVGEIFYANKFTGEARWSLSPRSAFKKPTKAEEQALVAKQNGAFAEVEGEYPGEGDEEEEITIGEWTRIVGTEGVFYMHANGEDSQWDPPEEFAAQGYT